MAGRGRAGQNRSKSTGGSTSRPFFIWGALALALLASTSPARAQEETRALWVVRYSLTSSGSVDRVVEVASQMNQNTLFVQVRGRGDAYYPSEVVPRAEELESMPKEFDPLARLC